MNTEKPRFRILDYFERAYMINGIKFDTSLYCKWLGLGFSTFPSVI